MRDGYKKPWKNVWKSRPSFDVHSKVSVSSPTRGSAIWKALKASLSTAHQDLEDRLQSLRQDFLLHLSAALRDSSSDVSRKLDALDRQPRQGAQQGSQQLDAARDRVLTEIQAAQVANRANATQLQHSLHTLHEATNTVSRRNHLVGQLSYPDMSSRLAAIQSRSAHNGTLEWVFLDEHADRSVGFPSWLRGENGNLFWVTGKPGSGKSVLMAWVASHTQALQLLRRQDQSRRLIVASHYFWISGSELQKSRLGLYRSLLVQLLSQCPDALRVVEAHLTGFDLSTLVVSWTWSLPDLWAAITGLIDTLSKLSVETEDEEFVHRRASSKVQSRMQSSSRAVASGLGGRACKDHVIIWRRSS